MKNTLLFLAALALLTVQSCKKDDDPTTGSGSNNQGIMLPPPGFSFPHTYYQKGGINEFRMWIKGVDVSSKFKPQDVFEQAELLPAFNITLRDQSSMEINDPTGINKPGIGKYFFARDTLFVIDLPDTIPLAKGNYSSFTIAFCEYKVTEKTETRQGSGSRSFGGFDFSTTNYQKLLAFAASLNISDPDTMAYHNETAVFK